MSGAPKHRRQRGVLTVRVTYRTAKQWGHCYRISRKLGMTQNGMLAMGLNLLLARLQRICDQRGIDWRNLPETDAEPARKPVEAETDNRTPRIED